MKAIDHWRARHPEWFDQAVISIESGSQGWDDLVDDLFTRIEETLCASRGADLRILQIKEKIGSIRVYHRLLNADEALRDLVRRLVNGAVLRSETTCEICGAPGMLCGRNGHVAVRCAQHSQG